MTISQLNSIYAPQLRRLSALANKFQLRLETAEQHRNFAVVELMDSNGRLALGSGTDACEAAEQAITRAAVSALQGSGKVVS